MFTAAEPAIFCFILINFDFTLGLLTSSVCPQVRKTVSGGEGRSLCNRNKSQCLLNKRKMLGIKWKACYECGLQFSSLYVAGSLWGGPLPPRFLPLATSVYLSAIPGCLLCYLSMSPIPIRISHCLSSFVPAVHLSVSLFSLLSPYLPLPPVPLLPLSFPLPLPLPVTLPRVRQANRNEPAEGELIELNGLLFWKVIGLIIIDAVTVTIVNFVALLSARSRLGAILIALRLAALDKLAINKHRTQNRKQKRELRKVKGENLFWCNIWLGFLKLRAFHAADLIHEYVIEAKLKCTTKYNEWLMRQLSWS